MKISIISEFVCRKEGFVFEDINTESRKAETIQVKHLIMYMAKRYTKLSLDDIGRHFKFGRGHSNVLKATNGINDLYDTDKEARLKIDYYIAHFDEIQKIDYLFIPTIPDLVDLKEIRIRLGLSLQKASSGIPMAKTYIYSVENGTRGSQLPYYRVKMMLEYYRSVALKNDIPVISY